MADFDTVWKSDPNHSQGRGNTQFDYGILLHGEALCKAAMTDFNHAQSYGSNKCKKVEAHVGSAWALYAAYKYPLPEQHATPAPELP